LAGCGQAEQTAAPALPSTPTPTRPTATPPLTATADPSGLQFIDIPEQNTSAGRPFLALDAYDFLRHRAFPPEKMTWTLAGGEHIAAAISNGMVTAKSVDPAWQGSETLRVEACEPTGKCVSQEIVYSVAGQPAGSNGRIAFASRESADWHIYVMNADGSDKRQVTSRFKGGYEPSWSPDGTKIVFQYNGLWVLDILTGERIKLPTEVENTYVVKPSWSPTGEWIAFLNEDGYRGDLYLIRPDGTDQTRLTNTADISRDGDLVWSPDGSRIAFSAYRGGNLEIFVMNVDVILDGTEGSQLQQLTESPTGVRNLVTSWSPDGGKLAFSSDRDGNTEIYLMGQDGSNVVRLTNNTNYDGEPCWSPDGEQIVFSSDRDGDIEVYVLNVAEAIENAETATISRLTEHKGDEAGPVWGRLPYTKE
jgi:Tol biopolymer transport system component